jgi:acyl-CoA synthetase (AMP-forming)/AMP-acid ligase II
MQEISRSNSVIDGARLGFDGDRPASADCLQACLGQPGSRFIHLIDEWGRAQQLSYQYLGERAIELLGSFQQLGLGPGAVLVLRSNSRVDMLTCLWACILGNITAIPVEAGVGDGPTREALHRHLLNLLIDNPRVYVLDTIPARQLSGWNEHLRPHQWIKVKPDKARGKGEAVIQSALPYDPRLLVLTSGTTGKASLVELSDRAVASRWWPNGASCNDSMHFLSWAPLDHVMGLSVCSPNAGCKVMLHTTGFLHNPLRWLELASVHRITHSTMTSFGMELIFNAISEAPTGQLKNLDLSCLEVIGIGAEPFRADVFLKFASALDDLGVHDNVYIQGYGLTECGPIINGRIDRRALAEGENLSLFFDELNHGHAVRVRVGHGRSGRDR